MSGEVEAIPEPQPLDLPILYIGVVSLLIAGLQPLVLGGLAEAGRLSASGIGLAATAELLALGLACGVAAAVLKPTGLRAKLALAGLGHAACNLATLWVADAALIGLRGVTGLCAGVMLWSAVGMIARSARPERQAGIFVTVQTIAQLLLAALLPRMVMASWGVDGALVALAAISLTAAAAGLAAPREFAPLPKSEAGGGRLSPLACAGLAAVFLYMAFIVAIWVYLEPLAAAAGLDPGQAHDAVAAALAMQVLGGLAATVAGARLKASHVLIGAGVINLGLVTALSAYPSGILFIGLVAVFGFLWLFVLPFHTALLIGIDPSRRAAMQLGTAQLLGSSAGPLAASLLVGDTDVGAAMKFAAACLAAALALIVAVVAVMARRDPVAETF
ncbi:MFS transporter [Phenylobacterium sp.]|uniref:MFS transporter n=1 Tax=Phenylobacterium sp. TaxID=1871053 RepID=UPI002FCAF4A4